MRGCRSGTDGLRILTRLHVSTGSDSFMDCLTTVPHLWRIRSEYSSTRRQNARACGHRGIRRRSRPSRPAVELRGNWIRCLRRSLVHKMLIHRFEPINGTGKPGGSAFDAERSGYGIIPICKSSARPPDARRPVRPRTRATCANMSPPRKEKADSALPDWTCPGSQFRGTRIGVMPNAPARPGSLRKKAGNCVTNSKSSLLNSREYGTLSDHSLKPGLSPIPRLSSESRS